MALTDAAIRAARGSKLKLFDGNGLYLLVKATGSRHWYMKFRFGGKEKKLSFGPYPEVTLREARDLRDEARRSLRAGVDPSILRKARRSASAVDTFRAVALEWLDSLANPPKRADGKKQRPPLAATTIALKRAWLDQYLFRDLGNRPLAQITAPELLIVLRKVEGRGVFETTHRVRSTCGRIFRYGIATSRCTRDVSADIIGALQPVVVTHHAAITNPREVGELLRAIDGYGGEPVTRIALQILPLIFLRSRELRFGTWPEINFDAAEWRVPGPRMKMKLEHIVPLSTQAIAKLQELQSLTNDRRFMFPSANHRDRPMSENTVNAALRRMGYAGDEMTGHGFRSVARTLLAEIGWVKDPVRIQLAHVNPDQVDGAYNRAELLDVRRKMMQEWADYLDTLRVGGNVISFPARKA